MKKLLCMILSLLLSLTLVSIGIADRNPSEVENIQEGILRYNEEFSTSDQSNRIEAYYHPEDESDPEYLMILIIIPDVSPDYFDLSDQDQFIAVQSILLMAAFEMYDYVGGYVSPDTVLPDTTVGLFCGESAEFVTSMKDITYEQYIQYKYGGLTND